MHLVMFDIDGTLVKSYDFDAQCFARAVKDVLSLSITTDWSKYRHVTDSGIVNEIISANNISGDPREIHEKVKERFIEYVSSYLRNNKVEQVAGAADFLSLIRKRDDVVVSFATGGWRETALLKLSSAGIDRTGICIASSSDHFKRTEIMRTAEGRTNVKNFLSKSYFGDGVWDKEASRELGYNFILLGNRTDNEKQIDDFSHVDEALAYLGFED